jgi:hydrogenase 3 maturation protease
LNTDLKKTLSQQLKNSKKLVILGIGSELMQDDAAGITVTENLKKKFGEENSDFKIYTGYTTPENFTKSITDFNPDHIIIIDAADLKLPPGSTAIIPLERIMDFSPGTHKLSLIMMIKYLKEVINPEFTVIAIQYKSLEFNKKITKEIKTAISKVSAILGGILENSD